VQISANSLIGMIFHVPDGIQRVVRNEIYRGRSPERYYDALEWVFTPPDYVREFSARRKALSSARTRSPRSRAVPRRRSGGSIMR